LPAPVARYVVRSAPRRPMPRVVRQRPLQRLGLVPRCVHPNVRPARSSFRTGPASNPCSACTVPVRGRALSSIAARCRGRTGKPLQIAVDGVPGTTEATQHLPGGSFNRAELGLGIAFGLASRLPTLLPARLTCPCASASPHADPAAHECAPPRW
jgi:hypothetical protein